MSELLPQTEDVGAGADESAEYQMYIDGVWEEARNGERRPSVDPLTGRAWASVPDAGPEDVEAAVAAARRAFDSGPWRTTSGAERARLLRALADSIAANAEDLAKIETRDNGKLLREMAGQLASVPAWYEYFAGWADKLGGEVIPTDKSNFLVYSVREPVGVVAAIVPWNSPLLLTAFKLAPALAAGCTVVLKPAEQTPVSALAFAKLVDDVGFPPGVVNVITGDGPAVGAPLVAHPGVERVAFTGSTAVGIEVAKSAASHLAEASLELGGKSPNIVFADADFEAALNGVVAGVFAATGQTCIAGSRLFVEAPIFDEFVQALAERARTIRLGDPMAAETEMGPVAFPEQLAKIEAAVAGARSDGANVVCGGRRARQNGLADGLFFEPTVLTGLSNDAAAAREEIFGPVVCAMPFSSEDQVVQMANNTEYGLAAGVWTLDVRRAHRVAARMDAGTVWINAYRTLTYSVPFGGYKKSGLGRENGAEAIKEYTRIKSVWVELSGQTRDPFMLG